MGDSPKASSQVLRRVAAMLLPLGLLMLGWVGLQLEREPPEAKRPVAVEDVESGSSGPGRPRPTVVAVRRQAPPRTPDPQPAQGCAPQASHACLWGDLWWLDGCGEVGEKAEECGAQLCIDGACEVPEPGACAGLPLQGRCEGQVVVGCIADTPYRTDCAARGKRCVVSDEGAGCREVTEEDCDPLTARDHCEGEMLLSCMAGRWQHVDCQARGGRCSTSDRDEAPACVQLQRLARLPTGAGDCGPCGCEPPADTGLEVCNGVDDDSDEKIDEQTECAPVDLVAFVITDLRGNSSYEPLDLEREVERVNRVLASSAAGLPLKVKLAETVYLAEPDWMELESQEFHAAIRSDELALPRQDFFLPVLFTDTLIFEDAPKAGVSTRPNGSCGGRRVDEGVQDLRGAIALAKRRAPTTLAHEIGHYLGLCHTHFRHSAQVQRIVQAPDANGVPTQTRCEADAPLQLECPRDGDGLCDTPADPGPDGCSYDQACQTQCRQDAQPDPFNVMSYYTSCRYALSPEQRTVMRTTLALRAGWHRCRDPRACPCSPVAPTDGTCPAGMGCYPLSGSADPQLGQCKLEGWLKADAACTHHRECAGGALCLSDGLQLRCSQPQASSARL